ncbi:MAG: sigma-70 family RNA polymerase sigma factor [Myxococcales bacterium]|nr:sigma-70 family RNA polymerase sigma factor [Myxococcales bacterium]
MTNTAEIAWDHARAELVAFVRARLVGREADAEDVVHECLVKLLAQRDVRDARAWLYRALRNAIVDRQRAAARARGVPLEVEDGEEDGETQRAVARCLRPLLGELPAAQREALERVELGGEGGREVARQLGISYSGLKSRVQRGRAALGEALRRCCQIELDARRRVVGCEGPGVGDGACCE